MSEYSLIRLSEMGKLPEVPTPNEFSFLNLFRTVEERFKIPSIGENNENNRKKENKEKEPENEKKEKEPVKEQLVLNPKNKKKKKKGKEGKEAKK